MGAHKSERLVPKVQNLETSLKKKDLNLLLLANP